MMGIKPCLSVTEKQGYRKNKTYSELFSPLLESTWGKNC